MDDIWTKKKQGKWIRQRKSKEQELDKDEKEEDWTKTSKEKRFHKDTKAKRIRKDMKGKGWDKEIDGTMIGQRHKKNKIRTKKKGMKD